jgi:hypothetical protein
LALPEPVGASLPQLVSPLDLIRHIINGGDKRIWRGMTKRLKPSSAPGEGMGIVYPVSVFAPELSGWLSVLTLALSSSDDDRSLAPFFPLSPLLFLLSDAAFVLKKARSSALPPRSPENNDYRPALALFPSTLPSPVLSFSPSLFASGHSTPYT